MTTINTLSKLLLTGIFITSASVVMAAPEHDAKARMNPSTQTEKKHHQKLHDALKALEEAKNDLEQASQDFGGHREAALKSVDVAIKDIHQCLEHEKKL